MSSRFERASIASDREEAEEQDDRLRGLFVVADCRARWLPREAAFWLRVRSGETWRLEPVEVLDGHWSADGPVGEVYEVLALKVGIRPARLVGLEVPLSASQDFVVRAALGAPMVLRVLDRESGRDLDGLELCSGTPERGRLERRLGADVVCLTSPLDLDAILEDSKLSPCPFSVWARCPGYAWNSILLDPLQGGERILTLERGYSVAVRCLGAVPPRGSVLRLLTADGAEGPGPRGVLAERSLGSRGHIVIDGVARGSYLLVAETPGTVRRRLGELALEVTSDLDVDLEIRDVDTGSTLPLFGTLDMGESWITPGAKLEVRSKGKPRSVVSLPLDELPANVAFGRTWNAGSLPLGSYEIAIEVCGFARTVDLVDSSPSPVRIVVPDAVQLDVLVDDGAGRLVEGADVRWLHLDVPHLTGRAEPWRGSEAVYRIRAPAGRIELVASTPSSATGTSLVDAVQDWTTCMLHVRAPCALELRLSEASDFVPWDTTRHRFLVSCSHSLWARRCSEPHVDLPSPGTYVIAFDIVDGYAEIPLLEVEVGASETVAVDIGLKQPMW